MSEYKCKGCLIDSSHGKLQKKKDALLEFIFSDNSLCLTVSAQNMNIVSYTLSKESVASVVASNDMLVINLKVKKQVKVSAIGKNKIAELKIILDALLNDDLPAYEASMENFCNNSTLGMSRSSNVSKINQSTGSMNESLVLPERTSKKSLKTDKMKNDFDFLENDENSQPPATAPKSTTLADKPKTALHSAANFYQHSQNGHRLSTDETVSQQPRKRTIDTTQSSIRFEHATNSTSPYFSHKPTMTIKRQSSIGESRNSPLANIYSKPLNSTKLWDDENYFYDWRDSPYSTRRYDARSTATTTSETALSQAVTSTMNLRKKGLRNIGSTCYMNSILQCLLNIDPFRYDLMVTNAELITSCLLDDDTIYLYVLQILALLQDRQSTQTNNSTTTQLTDEERTVESQALSNLKKAVEKHSGNFFGSRQQDSHEFLNLVVSLITDEIEAIKVKLPEQSLLTHQIVDPTTNNFQFCLVTERRCDTCSVSTTSTEIHTALLIHVTDEETKTSSNSSLSDLLNNYFASESMDGCYCETCQSNQLKHIKYSLERLPRMFVFYLKRWHVTKNANGEMQSVSKEDHPIDCSLYIDVSPFCSSKTLQPPMLDSIKELPNIKDLLKQRQELPVIESKRARLDLLNTPDSASTEIYDMTDIENNAVAIHGEYRLFAVINHHGGSSDVGHYTSTVYDAKGDTWWTYDDTSVTSCTEHRVLKYLAPDAYGVMYMHKDVLKLFQPVINNTSIH